MANGGIPPILTDTPVLIDPCTRKKLAEDPPLDGRTDNPERTGVSGLHCGEGAGVTGIGVHGTGVVGEGPRTGVTGRSENGWGVFGSSRNGEGIAVRPSSEARRPAFGPLPPAVQ